MYNVVCLLLTNFRANFANTGNLITAIRSAYMGEGQTSTLVYSVPISPDVLWQMIFLNWQTIYIDYVKSLVWQEVWSAFVSKLLHKEVVVNSYAADQKCLL